MVVSKYLTVQRPIYVLNVFPLCIRQILLPQSIAEGFPGWEPGMFQLVSAINPFVWIVPLLAKQGVVFREGLLHEDEIVVFFVWGHTSS